MKKGNFQAPSKARRRRVVDQSQHGVAHRKRCHDEIMREGFIPSSAPGKVGRNLNTPYPSL